MGWVSRHYDIGNPTKCDTEALTEISQKVNKNRGISHLRAQYDKNGESKYDNKRDTLVYCEASV